MRAKVASGATRVRANHGTAAPVAEFSGAGISGSAAKRIRCAGGGRNAAHQQAKVYVEPVLDEETQKYIAQALTDVDLFSSYGLTQKAMHLLESVLQKAPRHTPALERLLDITLGTGDELRTAQLAAQLEQINLARGDQAAAEKFAELRQRYQGAAMLSGARRRRANAVVAEPSGAQLQLPHRRWKVHASVCRRQPGPQPPSRKLPNSI